ncbi:YqhR family membrane protein [Paenibacillus puerhi]|uniref:YqhR family membrane protein n=1 Tax=Paenibacillus puerhi TaxID=2692622 RepID=UPI001357546C|nr:YqhR family membrane protein [Paenibacillus puerhi]
MSRSHGKPVRTGKWSFALYIGFFAGLVWGGIKIIQNYFHFTSLPPGFMLEPFFLHKFLLSQAGFWIGWAVFTLFSVIASLLYALILAKAKGPWYGLGYGIMWWIVIFLFIGPITGMTKWIAYMELNTVITEFCLFVLWGLFIGYSISFEFTDERSREPDDSKERKEPEPA